MSATVTIDDLMKQAQSISADDPEMMDKLQRIAEEVAAIKRNSGATVATQAPVDPADALGCEGCQ